MNAVIQKCFRIRWLASIVLLVMIDTCTFFAFKKGPGTQLFTHQDKTLHALAFCILFVMGYVALNFDIFTKTRRFSFKLLMINWLGWLVYAAFLEIGQYFTSYREASFGDMIADGIGIILGTVIVVILKPHPSHFRTPSGAGEENSAVQT